MLSKTIQLEWGNLAIHIPTLFREAVMHTGLYMLAGLGMGLWAAAPVWYVFQCAAAARWLTTNILFQSCIADRSLPHSFDLCFIQASDREKVNRWRDPSSATFLFPCMQIIARPVVWENLKATSQLVSDDLQPISSQVRALSNPHLLLIIAPKDVMTPLWYPGVRALFWSAVFSRPNRSERLEFGRDDFKLCRVALN